MQFFPATIPEAIRIQQELRDRVMIVDVGGAVCTVAGIDVGYDPARNISKAALVLFENHVLVESVIAFERTPFPYVSGLLSFREVPVILRALSCLKRPPDLLMVDGHGIAHPRRLGIAAHVGVLTDLPSIGVAKKKLCGHFMMPGLEKGARSDLIHRGEKIGTVLRSKTNVAPLFISPGHRMTHTRAVALVESYLTRTRLPDPTHWADRLSKF
ncbi:MAG: deoxyribonuclease V [Alphaproteobacteria bacterium]|nr:deoxyribonuclease V [Alphaproteobacteria bacterium]